MDELKRIGEEALKKIQEAADLKELNDARVAYLGKKSPIQAAMKQMRDMSKEERANFGKISNEVKQSIAKKVEAKKAELEALALEAKIESEDIDISLPSRRLPAGSLHPITIVKNDLENLFLGMGYEVAEGPEVETDHYNFELMNLPKGHPARDMQDTFYIDENTLMRTHTSPVQAHVMLDKIANGGAQPIKVICPGKTYRRDDDDATHSHQFAQCEGLVVDKNITMADLKGTLELFVKKMFGEKREIRLRPSYFPFTEPSVELVWSTHMFLKCVAMILKSGRALPLVLVLKE